MIPSSSIDARLGVVSYLNTLPLIDGLDRAEGVEIVAAVPSSLAGLLAAGATDLSLCSVIDQQRSEVPLELVPVGQIGCDGPTWTVRLFSNRPLQEIEHVGCDGWAHCVWHRVAKVVGGDRPGRGEQCGAGRPSVAD